MHEESAPHCPSVVVACCPHVVRGDGDNAFKVIAAGAGVRAGDQGPGCAIPMGDEGTSYPTRLVTGIAHSPDIIGIQSRQFGQVVVLNTDIGTWEPVPGDAVPMQDKALFSARVACRADSPQVRRGEGSGAAQVVIAVTEAGTAHHSPP